MKQNISIRALPIYILALALLCGCAPSRATADPALEKDAAPLLEKARQAGSVRVLVGLKIPSFQPEGNLQDPAAVEAQRAAIRRAQASLLERHTGIQPGSVKRFATIPFLALEANAGAIEALGADPEVLSLKEDRPVPAGSFSGKQTTGQP